MLRPAKNISKFLLSTPARFVGEYETEDILVAHAWDGLMGPRSRASEVYEGPTFRTYVVVAVELAEEESGDKEIRQARDVHWLGDFFAVCMGVLFGKQFDHHGAVETEGFYCLPAYRQIVPVYMHSLPPFNGTPRTDTGISLNFEELARIKTVLHQKAENHRAAEMLATAGKFYLRALRLFDEQPDVAFLDLVTTGEVLSNYYTYPDDKLIDSETQNVLSEIQATLPDGDKKSRALRQRMLQVKRRFTLTVRELLNSAYFENSPCTHPAGRITLVNVEQAIKAAYDLRSKYVHTGHNFAHILSMGEHRLEEKLIGTPVCSSREMEKLLSRAPTLLGLERMMRFALIRFLHLEICRIDDKLN
ncbi:MAG: HEPN domain-containing protein [Pirellulaceae bacterium]